MSCMVNCYIVFHQRIRGIVMKCIFARGVAEPKRARRIIHLRFSTVTGAALILATSALFTSAQAQHRGPGVYRGTHGGVAVAGYRAGRYGGYRGTAVFRGPHGGVGVARGYGYRGGYSAGRYYGGYRGAAVYRGPHGAAAVYRGPYGGAAVVRGYRGYGGFGYGDRIGYGYGPYGGYGYSPQYDGYYGRSEYGGYGYSSISYGGEPDGYSEIGYGGYGDVVSYCVARFQSYNPYTGTYVGWDGFEHTCP